MLKKVKLLFFLSLIVTSSVFAGPGYRSQSCPKVYIGPSIGFNNTVGLVGVNFDVPVTGRFSLGTGAGLSSWGLKSFFEGRLYFKDCNRGWAIGTGVTYNTGLQDFVTPLPTTFGDQDVMMDLEPLPSVFLSAYHFFNLGRRNRFYLQLGYSQRLVDKPYTITSGHILDADGEAVMDIVTPGGVMFALGFSFGIGG